MTQLLNALSKPFTAKVRISSAAVVLLCASAVLGNVGQYIDRARADEQVERLREVAASNNQEAQCRSRVSQYTDALSLELAVAGWSGLLDRAGPNDDVIFEAFRARAERASELLEKAIPIRDQAVQICADNPTYDIREALG